MIKNRSGLLILGRQHLFHDAFEQSEVSVDFYWQPEIRKVGAAADCSKWVFEILRILEPEIAGLRQRIDADDFRAIAFGPLQRG